VVRTAETLKRAVLQGNWLKLSKDRPAELASGRVAHQSADHDNDGACEKNDDKRDADVSSFHENTLYASSAITRTPRLIRLRDRSFQDDGRQCVMFGVAESDQRGCNTALYGKLLRGSRKKQKRFATLFFPNVDIA